MAIEPGTRFGHYDITGTLGAGGMGEVYRATDTKLGREVAIKTLPKTLADDKERLARFEREAKLLATLNHAHIAVVYGLDEQAGTTYIAMELVEGETLEEKLKSGALPVEDALRLALQVAGALEAAHSKGVVHRDLKPANIMLTADGQVKVLDFGLAKAFSGPASEASPLHSPALSVAMTQQGLVLGTAGYMSPEQASGQSTDQRADIWAFGVVLYEMLTGLPLFRGETVPHILADVLKTEPDWGRLPKNLHPRIRQLLERCLTKNPRSRLHSIADARIEIETVLAAPEGVQPVASFVAEGATAQRRRLPLVAGIAAAAVIAAAAGWLLRPVPEPAPGPVGRFTVFLPEEQDLSVEPIAMIAISPDGTRIAYAADGRLYLRNLGDSDVRPLQGTESTGIGPGTPVFSPDGQWLAYVDVIGPQGPFVIKRVPVSGGAAVRLHEASGGAAGFQHGLSWPEQDVLLFRTEEGFVRMPANGGATELLAARNGDERLYSPQLLPGGKDILYTRVEAAPGAMGGYAEAEVIVQSIGGDDRTVVWSGGSAARYLPTGHLVYAQGAALFAIPFDPVARAVSGGPVPLVESLRRSSNGVSDTANFDISATGTLVFMPDFSPATQDSTDRVRTTLAWIDRNGQEEPIPVRADDYTAARISPDGTKAALIVGHALARDLDPTIWIYDFGTGNLSLLTTEFETFDSPVWSADSGSLYFRAPGDTAMNIWTIDLDTRDVSLVVAGSAADGYPFPTPWSLAPDEATLAIVNALSEAEVGFALVDLTAGEFRPGIAGGGFQGEPVISPSGDWLAYHESNQLNSGYEINVVPFPALTRTRIPVADGDSPVFSRDGSELFFHTGNGISVADVTYEPNLAVGVPRQLLESDRFLWTVFGRTWDPDPAADRFLVIRQPGADNMPAGESERLQIEVVLNWFEELKARVPVD